MCCNETIPDYLHQNGRSVVEAFGPRELVYRRYPKEPVVLPGTTQISAEVIRLREDSYNRELFCESFMDVLYDETQENNTHFFADWGVIAFFHAELERIYTLPNLNQRRFRASIVHSPHECMYSHCHQIVLEDSVEVKPPNSIRLLIREYMRDIYQICKKAQ